MSQTGKAVERGVLDIFKIITWIIYALAVIAIVVLGFAFVLLMLGAKPVGFAETIYNLAEIFLAPPFRGMITPTPLGGGSVISWNILIAIVVYALLAWILGAILDWLSRKIRKTRVPETPPVAAAPVVAAPVAAAPAPTPAPAPAAAEPPAPVEAPAAAEPAAEQPAEPAEPAGES